MSGWQATFTQGCIEDYEYCVESDLDWRAPRAVS